ncbi:MAG: hypothetical protein KDB53_13230, partial [Planctomycetes bacterium]|nr:hypothetical protein [Planctomycetota bacterium]
MNSWFHAFPFAVATVLLALSCPAQIDLVVVSVDASALVTDAQALTTSGTVTASIQNLGVSGAAAFDVVLFEDLDFNGAYSAGIDRTFATLPQAGLAAGASSTLL